jgi:hypothetical protein
VEARYFITAHRTSLALVPSEDGSAVTFYVVANGEGVGDGQLLLFANVDIRHCELIQLPGELPRLGLGYTLVPLGSHEEAREVSAHLGLPLPELNPGVVHHVGHA